MEFKIGDKVIATERCKNDIEVGDRVERLNSSNNSRK